MTSGDELLNCPFCGGAAEVREWDFPYVRFQARCVECKTTGRTRFNERAKAIAAWNHRTPPTPATDAREAVAQWCSGCQEVRSVDCYRADCPKSDTERRAAEILAAEANERARWADWARVRSALNHRWAAEGEHLRIERIALSSAYAELADAIERNEHGAGK